MNVDVAIIGGGAAGIGAARALSQARLTTHLFEASARLGGRAWTQEITGLDLDLGCGWLHSADRNSWAAMAERAGIPLDKDKAAWGVQFRDLGFSAGEQAAAWQAFEAWSQRLAEAPPASDRAADALAPGGEWNDFVRAIVSFVSGAPLENMSAADYATYDRHSTDTNWRIRRGLGALVAGSFPAGVGLSLATPVQSLALEPAGITLSTRAGEIHARAALITVSSAVLAGESIKLPRELDPWRQAAAHLPLGRNEKFYLEIVGDAPFEPETHVLGDPRDPRTGSYYIRPFGRPVVECFLGGDGARIVEEEGAAAGFAYTLDQLVSLFGVDVRRSLRPLVSSNWSRMLRIGGAYSYALPAHAGARAQLARPCDGKVFFAGEATSATDFSTAHGAHDSGARAAAEVIAALA